MPWWVKVDADIDDHPKACAAGFDACALFQFFLRVNGRREFGGVIPRSYWSTPYVQRKTGLDPSVVEARIQACVDADLLAIDGSNLVIVGWGGGEWDVAPKTDAERQQNRRDRLKNRHGESRERDSASRQSDAVTRVTLTDRPTDRSKTDRERESGARSRDDSPLTDATRTNLDADARRPPPDTAATPQHPQTPPDADALKAAKEVLDHWRDLRAAEAPSDRTVTPAAWPLKRDPLAMRLVPRVREKGRDALIRALDHGWQDRGDGKRWPGWHSKLATAEKVLIALAESELVDQAADAMSATPIRREQRDPRRGVGYGATAEQIAADAIKYAGGRASR